MFTRIVIVLAFALSAAAALASPQRPPLSLSVPRDRVYPALVNINVIVRYYADGRAQRDPAGGSGVIVRPDGYVLTNFLMLPAIPRA